MPYQSVFTLFIIGGAFCTTGGLVGALNWIKEGKRRRQIETDIWTHHLLQRDYLIKYKLDKDAK